MFLEVSRKPVYSVAEQDFEDDEDYIPSLLNSDLSSPQHSSDGNLTLIIKLF